MSEIIRFIKLRLQEMKVIFLFKRSFRYVLQRNPFEEASLDQSKPFLPEVKSTHVENVTIAIQFK